MVVEKSVYINAWEGYNNTLIPNQNLITLRFWINAAQLKNNWNREIFVLIIEPCNVRIFENITKYLWNFKPFFNSRNNSKSYHEFCFHFVRKSFSMEFFWIGKCYNEFISYLEPVLSFPFLKIIKLFEFYKSKRNFVSADGAVNV